MPTATRDSIGEARFAPPTWPFEVPLDIHSEDFLRLKRLLRRPGHFQLVIAQFNAPRYRDAIIAAASGAESPDTAEAAVWDLPEQPDINILQTGVADHASHAVALHLVGLDRWLAVSPTPIFQGLNYRREGIAKVARLPIVLWLAPEQVRPFAERAPDLWAWRAAVLDFLVEPQEQLSIEWEPLREGRYLDHPKARARLSKIEAHLQDIRMTGSTPDLELEAAALHNALADKEAARIRAEGALSRYLETGNDRGAAAAWRLLADITETSGDTKEALRIRIEEELSALARLGDRGQEAIALNRVGTSLLDLGELDEAQDYFHRSLKICREIGNREGEGTTLNNLSQIHQARGELDQALTLLTQSLIISEESGNRAGEAVTLNNLAQLYKARGDLDQASMLLERSLEIQQKIRDRAGQATTVNNLAQIHRARGEFDEALRLLNEALKMQQEIGDRGGEGVALNNISEIYLVRGEFQEALTLLQRSLAICHEIGYASGQCPILFNIGHIQWNTGERQAALKSWIDAYRQARSIGLAKALHNLEQLASRIGLPGGLAGWESLAHQLDTTGRVELPPRPDPGA